MDEPRPTDPVQPDAAGQPYEPTRYPARPVEPGGSRSSRMLVLILGAFIIFAAGITFGRLVAPPIGAGADHGPAASTAVSAVATASPAASADFGLIQQAYNTLQQNYVDPAAADPLTLIRGAIKGMTEALNDTGHTTYLTADQLKARDQGLSGSFVGVGAQLNTASAGATIVRVLPNSPAEAAGVKAGDTIISVDGQSVAGLSVDAVVAKVRGPEGSTVSLGLRSPGGTGRTLTITRAKIVIVPVTWAFAPGTHLAVIRLETFSKGATAAVTAALKDALAKGATGVALDLRGNPGGYVDEAIGVASQFLGSGAVYLSQDRSGTSKPHPVLGGGLGTKIPLVVIVDGQTASAAEIVTGALQDAGRATVVGEKTYGTGTVVATFPLSDGSALAIGTERWLTPKGREIWRAGLVPDKTVALPQGATYLTPDVFSGLGSGGIGASQDTQLQAALAALGPAAQAVPSP